MTTEDSPNGLPFELNEQLASQLKGKTVLVKYGGNAMLDENLKQQVTADIARLYGLGIIPVIVHGGGPFIKKLLGEVGIESEFVGGHRKTGPEAMGYIEMALSGNVNSDLVKRINAAGCRAVGLSGKDGNTVIARKRRHRVTIDGKLQDVDLGHVGDVDKIDTGLVGTLLENGYIPVISPVSSDGGLNDYNVNADMFAGHMAGALKAAHFVVLTDVNGLQGDPDDPSTLVRSISVEKAESEIGKSVQGGMIPKVESCVIALKEGVGSAHIINGTERHSILKELLTEERSGTIVTS